MSDLDAHSSAADALAGALTAGADGVGDGAGVEPGLVVGHVLQGEEAAELAELRLLGPRPDNGGGGWSSLLK